MQRNDLGNALAEVRTELKAKPNSARLLYLKAEVLSQRGAAPDTPEYAEAVSAAERALHLDPSLVSARDVLGKLYLTGGHYAQAAEQSRLALKSSTKDDAAIYHLIQALRKIPGDNTKELESLVKQLAATREQERREESKANRYKLIEEDSPGKSTE
jgi:tetratricopeptide (TPR) repeat protein